jgi:hypothetical protein
MVRSAKTRERPYKLFDETGLYLIVKPEGGKWWRVKYRFGGKEQSLSLGTYPAVSLKQARLSRDTIRQQVREGVNPSDARKAQDLADLRESFESQAQQWHEARAPRWSAVHAQRVIRDLERDVLPWIGKKPIADLTSLDLKPVLAFRRRPLRNLKPAKCGFFHAFSSFESARPAIYSYYELNVLRSLRLVDE